MLLPPFVQRGEGLKGCGRRMTRGGRGKQRGKAGAWVGAESRGNCNIGTWLKSRTVSLSVGTHEKKRGKTKET